MRYQFNHKVLQYALQETLDESPFIHVFKARIERGGFQKKVILKEIFPDHEKILCDKIFKDLKNLKVLSHPNLLKTYDLLHCGSHYLVIQEYLSGKSLMQIMNQLEERGGEFLEILALDLVIKILKTLQYVYSKKEKMEWWDSVAHENITPENIFVTSSGHIKLADFGVSRITHILKKAHPEKVLRKMRYMSPERLRGEPLDFRTDIYSVGAILLELLKNKPSPNSEKHFVNYNKYDELRPLNPKDYIRNLSKELEAVLKKALDSDPEERYESPALMIEALESYLTKTYSYTPTHIHYAKFLRGLFGNGIDGDTTIYNLYTIPQELKSLSEKIFDAPPVYSSGSREKTYIPKMDPLTRCPTNRKWWSNFKPFRTRSHT